MKKIYRLLVSSLIAQFLCSGALAQIDNVGTSAANFLKIGIGSRAQAMGGAYVAQADEVTALYWNPAGITHIEGRQIGFTYVDWITDVNLNFIGGVVSISGLGNLGVALTYLSMGDMQVTNWEQPQGTGETFTASDFALGITLARKLTERFAVGVQLKYIREEISNSSASAFAIDIGTQYNTGFYGLKLGMALTNFGSTMRMEGRDLTVRVDPFPTEGSNPKDVWANLTAEEWSLPIAIRLGASMDLLNNDFVRVTGNFDFYDARDVEQKWFAGGEAALFNERVFLRAGLSPYYEEELRPSFGAGFKHSFSNTYTISIDYAYSDLGRLENANRFSLGLTF